VKEDPSAAMIWDLTERFPRGPKGKIRKESYTLDYHGEVKDFSPLLDPKFGYSRTQLAEFSAKFFGMWNNQIYDIIASLKTTVADAGSGASPMQDDQGVKRWHIFSNHQVSRRTRKLKERLEGLKKLSEATATDRVYFFNIHHKNEVGRWGYIASKLAMPAPDEMTAYTQFKLFFEEMLNLSHEGGILSSKTIDAEFHPTVSSQEDVYKMNLETSTNIRAAISKGQRQIQYLEEMINKIKNEAALAENLALYIETFNINILSEN
jgi:hypothetical protein